MWLWATVRLLWWPAAIRAMVLLRLLWGPPPPSRRPLGGRRGSRSTGGTALGGRLSRPALCIPLQLGGRRLSLVALVVGVCERPDLHTAQLQWTSSASVSTASRHRTLLPNVA